MRTRRVLAPVQQVRPSQRVVWLGLRKVACVCTETENVCRCGIVVRSSILINTGWVVGMWGDAVVYKEYLAVFEGT